MIITPFFPLRDIPVRNYGRTRPRPLPGCKQADDDDDLFIDFAWVIDKTMDWMHSLIITTTPLYL